ncbi:hypothetical protein BDN72DRAFT_893256 [Pluteus cervinus]|uniref:Uncharacterized protein n=1 Tax=Pluteus cervinus TaxID=181527 RepID=A0ACD3B7I0_9AGAR|nr:hypothetical protein BDN72DRAFT_893256 [Pluteus cervinus]
MPDPINLPVELLLEIFSTLSVNCLLALAKTSRQFNSLCIPFFFSRHGISDASTNFEYRSYKKAGQQNQDIVYWKNDALAGLAIAFDLKSIEEFTCVFNDYGTPRSAEVRIRHYWKLLWTIRRLDRVGKVTLRFNSWDTYETWIITGNLALQRKQVITGLFNVCLQKGCKTFHIDHCSLFPEPPLAYPKSGVSRVLHAVKRILLPRPGPDNGRHPALSPYQPFPNDHYVGFIPLSGPARKTSQLQHLMISCPMAIYPPCSYWTHSVLQTPALTSLTLSIIGLSPDLWEMAFQWLIVPLKSKLIELSVIDCSKLPIGSFIDFLTNLQAVTHLTIILPMSRVDQYPPLIEEGKPILPKLVSLSANPDWITLLCAATPRPTLTSLKVVPRGSFSFGRPLGDLLPTLSKLVSPSPTSPPSHPLQPNSEQPKDLGPGIQITLDLGSNVYTRDEFQEDVRKYSSPTYRTALGPTMCDHITHLVIRVPAFRDNTPDVICNFFGWWKTLRCITLKDNYISEWEKMFALVWTEEKIEKLVEEARVHCPSITSMAFKDRTYAIGAVASGELQ